MTRDNVDRRWETADNIPEFLCSFSSFMNVPLVILKAKSTLCVCMYLILKWYTCPSDLGA